MLHEDFNRIIQLQTQEISSVLSLQQTMPSGANVILKRLLPELAKLDGIKSTYVPQKCFPTPFICSTCLG